MKAIVADGHQFANEAVALHPGALAHHDALLNFAKWPYEDPIAEGAFVKVAWLNDGHVFTRLYAAQLCWIRFITRMLFEFSESLFTALNLTTK